MMNDAVKCDIHDLTALFENTLSPAAVLSSKLMAQVSAAITKERLKLHMTQTEFAQYISVTQSQISRWEHGDYNFSLEKIADIASRLNLDINISFVDMSVHKYSETYESDYAASPQTFTFVEKNNVPEKNRQK